VTEENSSRIHSISEAKIFVEPVHARRPDYDVTKNKISLLLIVFFTYRGCPLMTSWEGKGGRVLTTIG